MTAKRQIILRKFDQKNQLLDTYIQELPKFDIATLTNYLGFTESNGKLAVFTKTYSNKAKKSEIIKIEFDKATAKFNNTVLDSSPILSAMKSGDVTLQKSVNGNFTGIVYTKYRAKGEAEKNLILVLDNALNIAWKRDLEFTNEHTTQRFTVTNSGKVALLHDNSSFKKSKNNNYLTVVTADTQEDKAFETQIFLQDLKAISIGAQDYILAFNSASRGLRPGDFTHILFYDLQSGKIIQNIKISEFTGIKNLSDVTMTNISLQNNEIHIFAEAKVEAGTKAPEGFSSSQFPETAYTYGPAYLYIVSFEGALNGTKHLTTINSDADTSHSFGLLNVKGNYYINTAFKPGNFTSIYSVLYKLTATNNYEANNDSMLIKMDNESYRYAYQLLHYYADRSTLLTARVDGAKKMALVNVLDVKL
jgi:hypothetical protein